MQSAWGNAVVARRVIEAFSNADLEGMRSVLAKDLVAYITTGDGGMERVEGDQEYLERVEAMDLPSARFSVTLTQAPVIVDSEHVLAMVEIRAERRGRSLHNFAAHLLRIRDGRIGEWWMADAKPAESEQFWS